MKNDIAKIKPKKFFQDVKIKGIKEPEQEDPPEQHD